jgi:hypothetical protein
VLAVELVDALLVDQLDREVTISKAGRFQRGSRGALEARVVCLDLDQRDARRRSSDVCRALCSS